MFSGKTSKNLLYSLCLYMNSLVAVYDEMNRMIATTLSSHTYPRNALNVTTFAMLCVLVPCMCAFESVFK